MCFLTSRGKCTMHHQYEDKFKNERTNCIEIRVGKVNMNNLYCSRKGMESWIRVGKLSLGRNTPIHFLNFEIYKRSHKHKGRALAEQITNYGPQTDFPCYILTNSNKEDTFFLSSSDAWQLCMLSAVNCHQNF